MSTNQPFSDFEQHRHNGLDAPKINPKDLMGFTVLTSAPTHKPQEGTILLANESGTYKLYAFINGAWRTTTLT